MRPKTNLEEDDGSVFLDRVHRRSCIIAALGALIMAGMGKYYGAASFLAGAVVSILLLVSARHAVPRIFHPGARQARGRAAAVTLVRWVVTFVALWLVVRWRNGSIPALLAGATVVSAVMFGMAIGDWRREVRGSRMFRP